MATDLSTDLISKIRALYPHLTKSERRVAEYIVENTQTAIYQSITELAECCQTSEATVFRTCKSLGFSSFQEFKVLLAQATTNSDGVINGSLCIEDGAATSIISDCIFESTIQALRLTQSVIDLGAAEKAAEMIFNSKCVFILGLGSSQAIAMDLQHKLLRLGILAIYQPDIHIQRILISNQTNPGDTIFAISHSGSSKDVLENAQIGKEKGANVIALTGYGKSPLSKISDIHLYSFSEETKHSLVAMSSRIAAITIIDILHTIISNRHKEFATEHYKNVNMKMVTLKT